MLTNLDFIADGKPWPPEDRDEMARLDEHVRMRRAYAGLHDQIFPGYAAYLSDAGKDPKKQKIVLDWPYIATSSYMHLLFGEEPVVLAGDRVDLPDRPDEQVFTDVSRYGIGIYEVSDAGIHALNPENCFIVVEPDNIQRYQAFVFFSILHKEEKDNTGKSTKKEYVKFTIHTRGKIQHQIFEVQRGQWQDKNGAVGIGNPFLGGKLRGPWT